MLAKLVTLSVIAAACHSAPKPGSPDARAIESVENAWRATPGLPSAGNCLANAFVERHTDYKEFKEACHSPFAYAPDPRVLAGCTTWGFSSNPWGDNEYTIHIAPDNPHEFTTVQHESCHVLVICTGLHPNGDALHTDQVVWLGGGPTSVEARARAVAH